MKCLSIKQPWAWMIINEIKTVENRTWPISFRGSFLIHASKTFDMDGFARIMQRGVSLPSPSALNYGGIVGIAKLVDCITTMDDPWFEGPYGFVLKNIRTTGFMPLQGHQKFFEVSDDMLSPLWNKINELNI